MLIILNLFFLVVIFFLGLAIGSFLNVCIYRLPRKESILLPPSHCPTCQTRLQITDLFPLFSFLFLRGKCRYCKNKIHWRYPLVELITGLGFVLLVNFYGFTLTGIMALIIYSFVILITFIDLEHYLILNNTLLVLFLFALLYHFLANELSLLTRLGGMAIGFAIPFFLAIISRGGMGGGDIKLSAVMGFWLGFPAIFQGLFIAALLGSIVGITLLLMKIKQRKEPIPFGPFLMFGFFIVFLFHEAIHFWYWALF